MTLSTKTDFSPKDIRSENPFSTSVLTKRDPFMLTKRDPHFISDFNLDLKNTRELTY